MWKLGALYAALSAVLYTVLVAHLDAALSVSTVVAVTPPPPPPRTARHSASDVSWQDRQEALTETHSGEPLPFNFVPTVHPVFPLRFRAKCRFLIGPSSAATGASSPGMTPFEKAANAMSIKPTLMLLHADAYSMKLREDFYFLSRQSDGSAFHRRFLTAIRHFDSESEWIIYHKQPKSPRACFEIPFSYTLSSLLASPGFPRITRNFFLRLIQQHHAASIDAAAADTASSSASGSSVPFIDMSTLEFQGLATVDLLGESSTLDDSSDQLRNITLLHYRTRNARVTRQDVSDRNMLKDGTGKSRGRQGGRTPPLLASDMPPVHFYFHPSTHQPLIVTTPHLRVDILSFQALDDDPERVDKLQKVFESTRASKSKCVPFTSSGTPIPDGSQASHGSATSPTTDPRKWLEQQQQEQQPKPHQPQPFEQQQFNYGPTRDDEL